MSCLVLLLNIKHVNMFKGSTNAYKTVFGMEKYSTFTLNNNQEVYTTVKN